MSEMLDLIMQSTEKMFKDSCTKKIVDGLDEGRWSGDLWNTIVSSGLLTIGVPEELGGSGGDYIDGFHILRLAGKYAVPLPVLETILVNWLLAEKGLMPLSVPVTFRLTHEPTVSVAKQGDHFTINGEIQHVPWGRFSQYVLVSGECSGENRLCLVPIHDRVKIMKDHNLAGEPVDTLLFENVNTKELVSFPLDANLSERVFYMHGLAKAAMMSGAMGKILDLTVRYAKEREQFERPLYKFQAIQHYLATLTGETIATRTITDQAIIAFQEGDFEQEIAIAKITANEAANTITELAHQIHGAIGITHEYELHHYTRRLWAWREEAGNETDWASILTKKLVNSEKNLWAFLTEKEIETISLSTKEE